MYSSRLGTKDYLSGQHYALWDYTGTQPVVDSVKLNSRQPWYSQEYNDDISYLTTQPWGWTQNGSFYVQRALGLKQYELNNHLGNVQATVTDKPVQQWSGGAWTHNMPALASAYDYYPFGMLMPGRYVSDTSVHCMTISTTTWVTKPWREPVYCPECTNILPNLFGGTQVQLQAQSGGFDMSMPIGGSATMSFTVEPAADNSLEFEISQITSNAQLRFAVVEDSMGVLKEIASELVTRRGGNTISFRPTGNTVTLYISNEDYYHPMAYALIDLSKNKTKTVQETILTEVCDEDKDRYRFGFNGQEKVNEWAGIGNLNDFLFRGQDTRTGRFISVDPLAKKYPWNSPYAFAENRPIDGKDLEGKEWESAVDANGVTNVSVNVNFDVESSANLSSDQINSIKENIQTKFNEVLEKSSGGTVKGKVSFGGGKSEDKGQVVPSLTLYGDVAPEGFMQIGGQTTFEGSSVNVLNKKGELRTSEDIIEDVVHELLHTVRLSHPFERTQGEDTRLVKVGKGNNYRTTPTTNKQGVKYNIMNYSMIRIDGEKLGDLWRGQRATLLTAGQIKTMLNEINLQKAGAGMPTSPDYNDYWTSEPGEEVKEEK